jgi:hypothetical protein
MTDIAVGTKVFDAAVRGVAIPWSPDDVLTLMDTR